MAIRVVLADDDGYARAGIGMILRAESDLEVVAEAADGAGAVEAVRRLHPDVAVLDVRMPGIDGIEATRRITSDEFAAPDGRTTAVLVLTTFKVDEAVYDCLRASASGFLLKDIAPRDLVTSVRAVVNGESALSPSVARLLIREFARLGESPLPPPEAVQLLTAREREVLQLMAYGMENADISRHLVLAPGTVKTHVTRILTKLGVHTRTQAVVFAYRTRLVGPDDPLSATRN